VGDSREVYDSSRIEAAIEGFRAAGLTPAEALLASARLSRDCLKRFRAEASAFREEKGGEAAADFARHELNDIISDLQDEIAPMIRTYNSLLREPGEGGGGPPE
jgi:hypothetical protein